MRHCLRILAMQGDGCYWTLGDSLDYMSLPFWELVTPCFIFSLVIEVWTCFSVHDLLLVLQCWFYDFSANVLCSMQWMLAAICLIVSGRLTLHLVLPLGGFFFFYHILPTSTLVCMRVCANVVKVNSLGRIKKPS